jgi:hypothetical protein
MKCNMKTMIATGTVLLVVLAAAYAAFPQFRTLVLSGGPFLLFLLCPLSMFFMMKSMSHSKDDQASRPSETSQDRQSQTRIAK